MDLTVATWRGSALITRHVRAQDLPDYVTAGNAPSVDHFYTWSITRQRSFAPRGIPLSIDEPLPISMKTTLLALTCTAFSLFSLHAGEPSPGDRKAILAMTGEFAVTFHFQETLSLQKEYTVKSDIYKEDAHELVVVTEDSPRRIALQHLLVAGDMVIKHWSQIWTFEDTRLCEFHGHNSWKMRDLKPEETTGTWSQQVTQVDDSPRYESFGRWVHRGEISEWTSADTARPLPRREHTKRKDYDIVGGTNRHTITPHGWAHEQDNTKLQLRDGKRVPLAREAGLNTYRRVTDFDFQPARHFWAAEAPFWKQVTAAWEDVQQRRQEITIKDKFDVPALRRAVTAIKERQQRELKGKINEVIIGFLDGTPASSAENAVQVPSAPAAAAPPDPAPAK